MYDKTEVRMTGALKDIKTQDNKQWSHRLSLQSVFNALAIVIIFLTTIGVVTCLFEIQRLSETTRLLQESLSELHSYGTNKVEENKLFYESEKSKTFLVKNGKLKNMQKRSILPTYQKYDPLSTNDKNMDDFCWTLLHDKCAGQIPGAPGPGPPGPPGIPGEKGEPGRPGHPGHMGPPGVPGIDGHKGEKGDVGTTGRIGEPGADGPRGPPGLPGVVGIEGASGRRGKRGLTGQPGQHGGQGPPGIPGLKSDKGEKGEQGDPGGNVYPNGNNCTCFGLQGIPGPQGPVGYKGEKGDTGHCDAISCGDKYVRRNEPDYMFSKHDKTSPLTTERISTTSTLPPTPTTDPPILEPRSSVCRIKRISTPIFVRHDVSVHGSFMSDPIHVGQFWLTRDYQGQQLEEFTNEENLKKRIPDKHYNLRFNRFQGTEHAIYNNSFYYHFTGMPNVVKYDLGFHNVATAVRVPWSHYNDSVYLYKGSKSYYDIVVDENGLWVIFGRSRGNVTWMHAMKLDPETLEIQRVWRLPFKVGEYKNAFIACGILYLVREDEHQVRRGVIEKTYDFYSDELREVNIELKIPFQRNTMLSFYTNTSDRRNSVLLAWDNGNLIKYPLLF